MREKRVFAVADVHGHISRLKALLLQEGIINEDGERTDQDSIVIQLGDLGHFGMSRSHNLLENNKPKSPTEDFLCYREGEKWFDYILWGNHDRAVFDRTHEFGGYIAPEDKTIKIMKRINQEGKYLFAFAAHDILFTHAGLHSQFKYQKDVPDNIKINPKAFANWINKYPKDKEVVAIVNAVGRSRGGWAPYGGILWRDATEKLYSKFRQIFGHSSGPKVRKYTWDDCKENNWSYCIDVGDADNGRLCGIWLPDNKIVEVNLNEERP